MRPPRADGRSYGYSVRWWEGKDRRREKCGFETAEDAHAYVRIVLQGIAANTSPHADQQRTLYAIQAGVDGPIKLGIASRVDERFRAIQGGNHERLTLIATASGNLDDEYAIHDALAAHRIRGEWFRPAPAVIEAVEYLRVAA